MFKKGQSGNPNGRPTAALSNPLKVWMKNLLTDNLDLLKDDFLKLDPKDRINIAMSMAQFIIPRLKQVDATIEMENSNQLPHVVQIEFIKDEEVKRIIHDFESEY